MREEGEERRRVGEINIKKMEIRCNGNVCFKVKVVNSVSELRVNGCCENVMKGVYKNEGEMNATTEVEGKKNN